MRFDEVYLSRSQKIIKASSGGKRVVHTIFDALDMNLHDGMIEWLWFYGQGGFREGSLGAQVERELRGMLPTKSSASR